MYVVSSVHCLTSLKLTVELVDRHLRVSKSSKLPSSSESPLTCIFSSIVGHETSAGVVSYTLNELARNQEIQNKLRSELAAAGFSEDSEREPTFDELMDAKLFPYLDAVTKES